MLPIHAASLSETPLVSLVYYENRLVSSSAIIIHPVPCNVKTNFR